MSEVKKITPKKKFQFVNDYTSYVLNDGNDGVNEFLAQGGAGTSKEIVSFVLKHLVSGYKDVPVPKEFDIRPGCTAIQRKRVEGEGYRFGRSYDFEPHKMMIIKNEPENGYKSVSSIDTYFITGAFGKAGSAMPMWLIKKFGLYVPVDGMNEKGLAMSVNMISDDAVIEQDTGKTRQIIVSAVRTILDLAATTDEALEILKNTDMRSWPGFLCHLAIADANGHMVVVEYIDNEIFIKETPVVTNFYMKEDHPKFGVGTEQSHIRYDNVMAHFSEKGEYSHDEMKEELRGVAKSNFPDDFHTTEWSIIYDQKKLTATYYRREDFENGFQISLMD